MNSLFRNVLSARVLLKHLVPVLLLNSRLRNGAGKATAAYALLTNLLKY